MVFNDTFTNLVRGILERVFYIKDKSTGEYRPPHKPKPGVFDDKMAPAYRHFSTHHRSRSTKWGREEFLSGYTGRKRIVYEKAADSLLYDRLTKADAKVKCFIKATEKTNFSAKPNAVPRIISPRGPRYGYVLGRYIKPIESRICRDIGRMFNRRFGGDVYKTVSKGLNARQTGQLCHEKWIRFKNPVAVGLDASRFDQHVSTCALKWEHSIYQMYYQGDKLLAELLSWQLKNFVTGYVQDGSVKYHTDGGRMSGDMNTGLGNCLIMCAMLYSYACERGVTIELINNGDDCVVFMETEDLNTFSTGFDQWFINMGFDMKVEDPVYVLEHVQFCQTQPVFGPDGYVMCREPVTALCKDSICTVYLPNGKYYRSWLYAVGSGGRCLTDGLPCFPQFYSSYIRASEGQKSSATFVDPYSGFQQMCRDMKDRKRKPTPETRVSFWRAFGVSADSQQEIEAYFDRKNPVFGRGFHESSEASINDAGIEDLVTGPTL